MQYTISTPVNPHQAGYAYGFLKVVPGPLYVYIAKGSDAVYTENSIITIDGRETYDPDYFGGKGKVGLNKNFRHKMGLTYSPPGGGGELGQVLLGMCRWHLRTPTPLKSNSGLFCGQL